jgi:putative two-component system response regulator
MLSLRSGQNFSLIGPRIGRTGRCRTCEIREREKELIFRKSRAAEFRDREPALTSSAWRITAGHRARPRLGPGHGESGPRVGTMHDVGKIGIPDYILLKPGKADARGVRGDEGACSPRI